MNGLINIGIVGAGQITTTLHVPVLRAMPDVRIVWITDANAEAGRRLADANRLHFLPLSDFEEAGRTCDIALLAIPNLGRERFFKFLARQGKAVFAEKPLALDFSEHEKLIAMFEPWNLAVGYQRRFHASTTVARRIIQSRVMGRLLRMEISEGGRVMRTGGSGGYQNLPSREGGGLTRNLGCHGLDLALVLTEATGFSIINRKVEWDGETDRQASAHIELNSDVGVSGNVELHWTASWLQDLENHVVLCFENGMARFGISPNSDVKVFTTEGKLVFSIGCGPSDGAITSSQAFHLQWRDMIESYRKQREASVSARRCVMVASLIDDVLQPGAQ